MKKINFFFLTSNHSSRFAAIIFAFIAGFVMIEMNTQAGENSELIKSNIASYLPPAPPITAADYAELLRLRGMLTYYDSSTAKNKLVGFTDTKIDLENFIRFYDGVSGNNFSWGIRFYPSFNTTSQNVSLILSVSKNDGSDNEKAFYLLADTVYNSSNKLKLTDTLAGGNAAANSLFQKYFHDVKINLTAQTSASDTFKVSRFYNYAEFLQFFSANIPDFNPADASTYSDYSLGVEFGYINSGMATSFYSRYGELVSGGNKDNYIGYTVLLSLYKNGTQLLDASLNYSATNYAKAIMEVGCPCPPKCPNSNPK